MMSDEPGAFAVSRKSARASIFVKWVVDTFKQEWLRDGGIIDIAGGRVSSTAVKLFYTLLHLLSDIFSFKHDIRVKLAMT